MPSYVDKCPAKRDQAARPPNGLRRTLCFRVLYVEATERED
jgi:hypothetical protein